MSAVGAVVGLRGRPVAGEVDAMAAALTPWGGDGRARWVGPAGDVGLVQVRRDLTPEDRGDTQPVVDPAGGWVLVAHARLDDRPGLARRLGLTGAERDGPDSVLLARGWARWGAELPRHLLGGFAVVVWDTRRRSLWAACDPMGECPLHWARHAGAVLVASHVPALAVLPGVAAGPNLAQLAHLLSAGRRPERPHETYLTGIDRVLPGRSLTADAGGAVRLRRWWRGPAVTPAIAPAEAGEALRAALDAAVADRCRVLGPTAAHCSGGLDSSAVTATAARIRPGRPVLALTAGTDAAWAAAGGAGPEDERPYLDALRARHPNVECRVVVARGSLLDVLGPLTAARGVPVRHGHNAVWLDALDRHAAARGARAVLIGQAGNATISYAGPDPVRAALARGAPLAAWREATAIAAHHHGSGLRTLARRLLRPDPVRRARGWADWIDDQGRYAATHASAWVLTGVRRLDPTADVRLVEVVAGLPAEALAGGGWSRLGARRHLADRLPAEIRERTTRGRQSVDAPLRLGAVRAGLRATIDGAAADDRFRRLVDVERVRVLLDTWPEPAAWRPADERRRSVVVRAVAVAAFLRWADAPTLPSPAPDPLSTG